MKLAAFGLLKTGKRVELVTDAVRSLNDAAAAEMTNAFLAAGGVLTRSAWRHGRPKIRRVGIFYEIFPRARALMNQHVLLRFVPWAFLP